MLTVARGGQGWGARFRGQGCALSGFVGRAGAPSSAGCGCGAAFPAYRPRSRFDAAPRDVTVAPADVEAPPEDGYRGDPNVACWSSFNATSADRGGYDWQKIVCAKLDDLSDTDSEKQVRFLFCFFVVT